MFEQRDQKVFVKLEGARKLAQDLPHAVQEEQEHRCFTPRLPVGVCRLGTALLKRVTRLHTKEKKLKNKKSDNDEKTACNFWNHILKVNLKCFIHFPPYLLKLLLEEFPHWLGVGACVRLHGNTVNHNI